MVSVIFDSLILRVSVTYDTMGSMRDAKKLEATISDIAKATLQNERAVRRHEESGAFELGDLLSVSRYVVGKRLLDTGFDLIGAVVMTAPAPPQVALPAKLEPLPEPAKKILTPLVVKGEVNAAMAKFLETAPGVTADDVEESEWEIGRGKWMDLAKRVELEGGLDDDSEWGEYNAGVIKYGSGKRR